MHRRPALYKISENYFMLDLLTSITVLIVVVSMLAGAVPTVLKGATAAAGVSEAVAMWRTYAMAYHAINGQWPEDEDELKAFMRQFLVEEDPQLGGGEYGTYPRPDGNVRDYAISEGAVHITMNRQLEGKVLTVRPATPEADPLGPVRWFAGPGPFVGWAPSGEDRTTVDDKYIVPKCIKSAKGGFHGGF